MWKRWISGNWSMLLVGLLSLGFLMGCSEGDDDDDGPAGPRQDPPTEPALISPEDGAEDISANGVELSWTASEDPDGGEVVYVVYLNGVNNRRIEGITDTNYSSEPLAYGTTYTWYVEAMDDEGDLTASGERTFSTEELPE